MKYMKILSLSKKLLICVRNIFWNDGVQWCTQHCEVGGGGGGWGGEGGEVEILLQIIFIYYSNMQVAENYIHSLIEDNSLKM